MSYKIDSGIEVEVAFTEGLATAHGPVWRLADWSFKIGDYEDGDGLERLALDSLGSYEWYGDGVDTLLFSVNSGMLHTVVVKLPDMVHVVDKDSFYTDECLHLKGTLVLKQLKKFRLNYCDVSFYCKEQDTLLIALTSDASFFKYDVKIELLDNVQILFYKENYAGWVFKNASSFIPCSNNNGVKSNEYELVRHYLIDYLHCFNEETQIQLESEDISIKNKLQNFKFKLSNEDNQCLDEIKFGIANLIEAYF